MVNVSAQSFERATHNEATKPLSVTVHAQARECNNRLRPEKFLLKCFRTGVQLSSPPPNKADSFDTRVSETISLCLFAKMPVTQGFSAYRYFGIVSLWLCHVAFLPLLIFVFCKNDNHAETLPPGKVSA